MPGMGSCTCASMASDSPSGKEGVAVVELRSGRRVIQACCIDSSAGAICSNDQSISLGWKRVEECGDGFNVFISFVF